MNDPLVSVVMPAYNHERFVGEAIASVLEQEFGDLELVIVDDGSTDGTAEVIASFGDARIRACRQANQDAYNAINRGLALARGRYLSIINSDDVYHRQRLARLVGAARDEGIECLFTDVTPITDGGEPIDDPAHPWNAWHRRNREFYFACGDLYQGFLRGNFMVSTSNLFMSRRVYEAVGDFAPLRYLHDYDYVFRILLKFGERTRYLAGERLLSYRLHGGNTLSEAAIAGREQDREVIRRYTLARCPQELRALVDTGIDRLVELEHELDEVRGELERNRSRAAAAARVAAPPAPLAGRVLRRIARRLGL